MENKFVAAIPEGAGNVVGMTQWSSVLVIACQNGVFIYRDGLGGPSRLEPIAVLEYSVLDA